MCYSLVMSALFVKNYLKWLMQWFTCERFPHSIDFIFVKHGAANEESFTIKYIMGA